MKKLREVMALFCCIYDVEFKNLVEKHELSAVEDVN